MRLTTGIIALMMGSTAPAQGPAPTPADEPIVVTGTRDDARTLSVNFERVALRCAECKRTLAKIKELAKPYQVKKGQIARDKDTMIDSIGAHTRGADPMNSGKIKVPDGATFLSPSVRQGGQQARLLATIPDHFEKEAELTAMRRDVRGLIASYLAQLEPYVAQAAEAEREHRGASGVVKADRGSRKVKPVDVTEEVIRRLDSMIFAIQLPSPTPHKDSRLP